MSRRLNAFVSLLALGITANTFAADAAPALKPGDMVGICGDSITEQKIYSVYVEDYLLMCKPASELRTMQFGWSGETSWGFLSHELDNDVLRFHPSVVTTCFGMNDGAYSKLTDAVAEHYRSSTQSIIDKCKAAGVRTIIIGSPGCVGDELKGKRADAAEYNKTLSALAEIDKQLAEKNGVIYADVFTPMMDVKATAHEKFGTDYRTNGNDGVHPGSNGHLVMAYAFLKAMGLTGDIGTITVDMASSKASATDGHKLASDSLQNGTVSIESTRYPFCFSGDPKDPNATTGVIQFLPFNQDLNRLTLVVKNAASEKVRVTWGASSREFTAAELAKGINLAAEFLVNPFSEQFNKVHEAVKAQQAFETPFIKNFVVNIPGMEQPFDEDGKALFKQLVDTGAAKDKKLFDTAAALVTPVHHTIKLEAVK